MEVSTKRKDEGEADESVVGPGEGERAHTSESMLDSVTNPEKRFGDADGGSLCAVAGEHIGVPDDVAAALAFFTGGRP